MDYPFIQNGGYPMDFPSVIFAVSAILRLNFSYHASFAAVARGFPECNYVSLFQYFIAGKGSKT